MKLSELKPCQAFQLQHEAVTAVNLSELWYIQDKLRLYDLSLQYTILVIKPRYTYNLVDSWPWRDVRKVWESPLKSSPPRSGYCLMIF
jgi:hypothetical protein